MAERGTDSNGYSTEPRLYQRVLNQSWPKHPAGIKDMGSIPITARIVLADDGETLLDGNAVRWTRRHVCVAIADPRLQVSYVWLDPANVRRR